jgi:hypothetical protein
LPSPHTPPQLGKPVSEISVSEELNDSLPW